MKIAVGLSGGVDSAALAWILKAKGHEVMGVTMEVLDDLDKKYITQLATKLGIDHVFLDLRQGFQDKVIQPFLHSYNRGETPNPCVLCNKYMKYGALLEYVIEKGADYLALGHYASLQTWGDEYKLFRFKNEKKDQSYNLYTLKQPQLSQILLPLGEYEDKAEVVHVLPQDIYQFIHSHKEIASREHSYNYNLKGESVGVCFAKDGLNQFLLSKGLSTTKPGEFVDGEGHVLGTHRGICRYTIGQKRHLGITPPNVRLTKVVTGFDVQKNRVIVGEEKDLLKNDIFLTNVNIISSSREKDLAGLHVDVRLSQWSQVYEGRCVCLSEKSGKNTNISMHIYFDQPVRAPAPGQSAVFYVGDELIGGGIIQKDFGPTG